MIPSALMAIRGISQNVSHRLNVSSTGWKREARIFLQILASNSSSSPQQNLNGTENLWQLRYNGRKEWL